MLQKLDQSIDNVINSTFITAKTNYEFAKRKLVPLIYNYEEQRNSLKSTIYKTLEKDIVKGCVMPPITIAFIEREEQKDLEKYINDNIENAFILDGVQRLTTLGNIKENISELKQPLYVNVLICSSKDRLLYRMITLNNGQKPMTARHQIEILATQYIDFDNFDIDFSTEKSKKRSDIKKDILVKGYLAFATESTNIDNQKIIEEMMSQLIMDKIINSEFVNKKVEFEEVISLIKRLYEMEDIKKWFKIDNNFIGFCSKISDSFEEIKDIPTNDFKDYLDRFEIAFSRLNTSKIKIGTARRKCVAFIFEDFKKFKEMDENKILDFISEQV